MASRGLRGARRVGLLTPLVLILGLALGLGSPAAQAQSNSSRPSTTASNAKAPKAARVSSATKASSTVNRTPAAKRPVAAPARPSVGQVYGLNETPDPLSLKSSVALVLDPKTDEVLFSKNSSAVLPIASITKLMTSLVVLDAQQDLDEMLQVTQDDVDTEKGSGSRLAVGTRLSRRDMMHLALMASENRAANALGRHYPGGIPAFAEAMNRKAQDLGMRDTRFVEPTGLSSKNQSSAHDLAILVKTANTYDLVREYSTTPEAAVAVGKRQLQFRNTNGLIRGGTWDIALQKTGYISEAGRCVVMQVKLAGRELIMVLLDSAGRYSRIGDAERLRKWIAELPAPPAAGGMTTRGSGLLDEDHGPG